MFITSDIMLLLWVQQFCHFREQAQPWRPFMATLSRQASAPCRVDTRSEECGSGQSFWTLHTVWFLAWQRASSCSHAFGTCLLARRSTAGRHLLSVNSPISNLVFPISKRSHPLSVCSYLARERLQIGDIESAIHFYKRAAESGDCMAQFELAKMCVDMLPSRHSHI